MALAHIDRLLTRLEEVTRECAEARALLKACEWGHLSPMMEEWRCPICGAEARWDDTRKAATGTHAPDCLLKAALGGPHD